MAMKTCGVCKEKYRSGGGYVYTAIDNQLARVRACLPCSKRSISVVFGSPPTLCSCGQLATKCDGCVDKKLDKVKTGGENEAIAKQLEARALAYREADSGVGAGDFIDGKIEATEDAAAFVRSGKWG